MAKIVYINSSIWVHKSFFYLFSIFFHLDFQHWLCFWVKIIWILKVISYNITQRMVNVYSSHSLNIWMLKHITLANLLKDFPMSNIDQNHSFKRNELYPVHLLKTSKIILISNNLMNSLGKIIHLPSPFSQFLKKNNSHVHVYYRKCNIRTCLLKTLNFKFHFKVIILGQS